MVAMVNGVQTPVDLYVYPVEPQPYITEIYVNTDTNRSARITMRPLRQADQTPSLTSRSSCSIRTRYRRRPLPVRRMTYGHSSPRELIGLVGL